MISSLILSRFSENDIALRELEPGDAHLVSKLHKTGFEPAWSEEDVLNLLRQECVSGYLALSSGRKVLKKNLGFILIRTAIDEAEILTIAVHPHARNRGIGRRLVDAVLRKLYAERIEKLFLEVDQTNLSALNLYKHMGFQKIGERKGYYRHNDGSTASALVMQRTIS